MTLKEFFSPAVIAAGTSLTISLITLYQFFKNRNFQEQQFFKANDRAFTTKLYDLRLQHYPKAFEILDTVYKEKGGLINPAVVNSAILELSDWKKGVVSLIISIEASQCFHDLRDVMKKNPALADKFSQEQIDKIITCKNEFTRQLRRDIGFMFREEKARRNEG